MKFHIHQNLLYHCGFLQQSLGFVDNDFPVRDGSLIFTHLHRKPLAQGNHIRVDRAFHNCVRAPLIDLDAGTRKLGECLCDVRIACGYFLRGHGIDGHETVRMLVVIGIVAPQRCFGFPSPHRPLRRRPI